VDRVPVLVTLGAKSGDPLAPIAASRDLIQRLGVKPCRLLLGHRGAWVTFKEDARTPAGALRLPDKVASHLNVMEPIRLTAWRVGPQAIRLGPLIGLLISRAKRDALLAGRRDTVYCRYAAYAQEVGAVLLFFAQSDMDAEAGTVTGYQHRCDGSDGCRWLPVCLPIPRLIYDRCFGIEGHTEAAAARHLCADLGSIVINRLPKITKLQAFAALGRHQELRRYLPYTVPFTRDALQVGLQRYSDLYLKPDALYKGKGIYRIRRVAEGWVLEHRGEQENVSRLLSDPDQVLAEVPHVLGQELDYVLQEGLALANYLGNRFDFRSLVQRDGQGQWGVTGLVARLAPAGSVITSPRSGGQIAPADRVLRYAFGDRWRAVYADLVGVSTALSIAVNEELGPCVELGLDMAVLADGAVKLIEVNGKPLRVSLDRLKDPLISQRIHRWPIHCAAYLDTAEVMV
jgi:hypothetical protein